jgi:hypothetical protein
MAIFNRIYPIQTFSQVSHAGAAVLPPTPPPVYAGSAGASVAFVATATGSSTRTGSVTTNIAFAATATGTSTRTGSVTASIIFAATATGSGSSHGGIGIPSQEPELGGNLINMGNAMLRSNTWG